MGQKTGSHPSPQTRTGRPPAYRRGLIAVAVLALVGLSGCDSMRKMTSYVTNKFRELPSLGVDPQPAGTLDPPIVVIPLQGTDWPGRSVLADRMAETLRKTNPNVRTAEVPDGRSQTIAGRIEETETRDAVIWMTVAWEYRTADGQLIGHHRQISVVDRNLWESASAEAVNLMVTESIPKLSRILVEYTGRSPTTTAEVASARPAARARQVPDMVATHHAAYAPTADPSSRDVIDDLPLPPDLPPSAALAAIVPPGVPRATAPPAPLPPTPPAREVARPPVNTVPPSKALAAWTNPVIIVRHVEGAPGDGNQSLTLAIREALRARDLQVTDDPRQAAFVLQGQVAIGSPAGGRQPAKIVWHVTTHNGGLVGKATQENAIPAGSLDGPWGQVAYLIANAAVDGIQELFGHGPGRRPSISAVAVPPTPPLPQVPGRAPPPPAR
jgi:hypothetical protein